MYLRGHALYGLMKNSHHDFSRRHVLLVLRAMPLSPDLIKKLAQRYAADAMLDLKWRGQDLTIKTDGEGYAILLFIGKRMADGKIRGERYARRLLRDAEGVVIKDHWDAKGKSS